MVEWLARGFGLCFGCTSVRAKERLYEVRETKIARSTVPGPVKANQPSAVYWLFQWLCCHLVGYFHPRRMYHMLAKYSIVRLDTFAILSANHLKVLRCFVWRDTVEIDDLCLIAFSFFFSHFGIPLTTCSMTALQIKGLLYVQCCFWYLHA